MYFGSWLRSVKFRKFALKDFDRDAKISSVVIDVDLLATQHLKGLSGNLRQSGVGVLLSLGKFRYSKFGNLSRSRKIRSFWSHL